jgi:TolB-like protein
MNPGNFFAELKRRNVYRVAVAYAVVAWLLIQIATQVFPFFEIPNWGVRLIVLFIVIGFPVALVLAWAFELTPEGLKRTGEVAPEKSIARTGRKLMALITVLAVLATGLLLYQITRPQGGPAVTAPAPGQAAVIPEKRIAVLPFENLSTDDQGAVFAGGVHREVLSNLAKIAALKVISRTSVLRYKPGSDRNVKQIADELGVVYLVVGTVQREGQHVRVNVELIDARSETQAWAETYDGNVADVLGFQTEIAQRITNQLGAKLSPRESTELASRPTKDIAAFESYIRARSLMETPETEETHEQFRDDNTRAVQLLEQSIARDPGFAAAYWALTEANIRLFRANEPPNLEYRTRAETALKEAQRIAPEAGETYYAQSRVIYYGYRDFNKALMILEQAAKTLPNSADVTLTRALLYRRFGRWQEAFAQFQRTMELNPQDPFSYYNAAAAAIALRWWDEDDRIRGRAVKLFPRIARPAREAEMLSLRMRGDVEAGNKIMEELAAEGRADPVMLFYRAFWKREYEECRRLVGELAKNRELGDDYWDKQLQLGFVIGFSFDQQAARGAEQRLEDRLRQPVDRGEEGSLKEHLANLKMLLGKKAEAIRICEESVAQHPISEDAVDNVRQLNRLAYMYLYAGENERALQSFAKLVQTPGGEDYGTLKCNPVLDPLRKDLRFEAILKQAQQPFPRL